MTQQELYKGFGEEHTAGTWARLLNVPRNTLWLNLKTGVTIEEFCSKKGLEYDRTKPKQVRKRMVRTECLVRRLLEASGYDTRPLEVKAIRNKAKHQIIWGGRVLGLYEYNSDTLHLSGGEGIKLASPDWVGASIIYDGLLWKLSANTKRKIMQEVGTCK